jgi:radical SAM protein with 4Fe4S-binding SPASM domain
VEFDTYLPLVVVWETTLQCNMRCLHCGSTGGESRRGELDTNGALQLCDELAEALCREVTLSGGEALLREDWWRIASRLDRNGIEVKLFSNGLLLNEQNLERALANGVRSICISMDGTPDVHDRIRGRNDSFRSILVAFQHMRALGLPIHVVTTVSRWNLNRLAALFEILVEENVGYWQIQIAMPYGRMRRARNLVVVQEEYLWLARRIEHLRKKGSKQGIHIRAGHNIGYGCELSRGIRNKKWMGCPAGLFGCGIDSSGNVKGCLSIQDPAFVEGNVQERSFWDIWFDERAFAYNRRFRSENLPEACRRCPSVSTCRGGCISLAYSLAAERDNDDRLCLAQILHMQK